MDSTDGGHVLSQGTSGLHPAGGQEPDGEEADHIWFNRKVSDPSQFTEDLEGPPLRADSLEGVWCPGLALHVLHFAG